jgi:hypothetical protein
VAKPFADRILDLAKSGDLEALKDYLRRGWPRTPAIVEFLVEYYLGEVRRPAQRPVKAATQVRALEIGAFAENARREGDHIKQAANHFKTSRTTAKNAWNAFDALDNDQKAFVMAAHGYKWQPQPPPEIAPGVRSFSEIGPFEGSPVDVGLKAKRRRTPR